MPSVLFSLSLSHMHYRESTKEADANNHSICNCTFVADLLSNEGDGEQLSPKVVITLICQQLVQRLTEICTDGWTDRHMGRQTNRWTDKWMDRQTNRWTDEQVDRQIDMIDRYLYLELK